MQILKNLKEGDKFIFPAKPDTPYFVEGQYPKFGCTTVCKASNIEPCSSGNGEHMTMVTGVNDKQEVKLIKSNAIHICHKVKYL